MSADREPCRAQHRIAEAVGKIMGTWVDPFDVDTYPALGYWAQTQQDVQRWTGQVKVEGTSYSIGSWALTLSDIRKGCKMSAEDTRGQYRAYNDFQFERD